MIKGLLYMTAEIKDYRWQEYTVYKVVISIGDSMFFESPYMTKTEAERVLENLNNRSEA